MQVTTSRTAEPSRPSVARTPAASGRLEAAAGTTPTTLVPGAGAILIAALTFAGAAPVAAQEHEHGDHDDHGDHHHGLHFTHPLIAESVSPDTKIRIDHDYLEFPDGDSEHAAVLEGEYAFTRGFSIEVGLPYSYTAGELGNLEAALKFANFGYEGAGLLLGYGVEFGFPTNGDADVEPDATMSRVSLSGARRSANAGAPRGRALLRSSGGGAGVEGTLGTSEWEVSPFLNVGYMRGRLELVGWTFCEIPFNQEESEEVATELAYNLSALYPSGARVQGLLELDGSSGISGEAVDEDVLNVSPGLRVRPLAGKPLVIGTSVGLPVTGDEEFDVRWTTALFWHF